MKAFKDFLFEKLQEYEKEQGKRITQSMFAEYLGISRTVLSYYLNGKNLPSFESAGTLAEKLGIEVYDYLGVPRPDEDLEYIREIWKELSPEDRHQLAEQAMKRAEKEKKNEAKLSKKLTPNTAR